MFPFNCIVHVSEGPGRSCDLYLGFPCRLNCPFQGELWYSFQFSLQLSWSFTCHFSESCSVCFQKRESQWLLPVWLLIGLVFLFSLLISILARITWVCAFKENLRWKVQNAADLGLLGSEKGLGIVFYNLDWKRIRTMAERIFVEKFYWM